MKRFNVVVPKKYVSGGEEKTQWNTVGTLVQFPASGDKAEGFVLEMFMYPNTTFKIFEQKDRGNTQEQKQETIATIQYPTEDINPNDIPF